MKRTGMQLILLKDDYEMLLSFLNGMHGTTAFDRRNAEDLKMELKKAKLVPKERFPGDVVRLNSIVKIKTEDSDELMELTLVTPDKADIRSRKISVMAPIGTALIGFRKGQLVRWNVPLGKKTFTIMDVVNENL